MKKIGIISCLLLVSLVTSNSGWLETPTYERPYRNPTHPTIISDEGKEVYITWIVSERNLSSTLNCAKFNDKGEMIQKKVFHWGTATAMSDKKGFATYICYVWGEPLEGYTSLGCLKLDHYLNISTQTILSFSHSGLLGKGEICSGIDANNNIQILLINHDAYYVLLDENGTIQKEFNITSYMRDEINDSLIKINSWTDGSGNLYAVWENDVRDYENLVKKHESKIRYLNLLANGTVKINDTLYNSTTKFLRSGGIVGDSNNHIYIFWEESDKEYWGLYDPTHTYLTKLYPNGTNVYTKEVPTLRVDDVKVDSNNNIHVIGTTGRAGEFPDNDNGVYIKLDTHGNVLLGPTQFTDKVYEQSAKLAVDSNGNVHIVWHGIERVWKRDFMGRIIEPVDYYTVYYSKLDSNGNIIINEMVLDADEKPGAFSPLIIIGIIIVATTAVVISLVVVKILLKCKKRRGTSKTPSVEQKYPPPW